MTDDKNKDKKNLLPVASGSLFLFVIEQALGGIISFITVELFAPYWEKLKKWWNSKDGDGNKA